MILSFYMFARAIVKGILTPVYRYEVTATVVVIGDRQQAPMPSPKLTSPGLGPRRVTALTLRGGEARAAPARPCRGARGAARRRSRRRRR